MPLKGIGHFSVENLFISFRHTEVLRIKHWEIRKVGWPAATVMPAVTADPGHVGAPGRPTV